ncbi:MAG: oligosaccharide flippase family protein [Hydrogenophilaceae bacterium]|nr:oligosaccharide flippase family protein [Hydrogenophilaceae bacterium]
MNNSVLTLKQRTIRAAVWATTNHLIRQVLRLGTNLVMTRLLAPDMFGVMAIANVFIAWLMLFSDFGLHQNIIQSKRGNDPVFLNTVWAVTIIRGAILCAVALFLCFLLYMANQAQWIPAGTAYSDPILPYVLSAMAINILVAGFESTRIASAARNLDQRQTFYFEIANQAIGIVCMLVWTLFDQSVWALVAGALAGTLSRTILSHVVLSGSPNAFKLDKKSIDEILSFGKWVVLSSLIGFLLTNGDRLILGAFVDPSTLGIYSIAFLIANTLYWVVLNIIIRVAYPVISEVARTDAGRLSGIYYKFRLRFDTLAFLLSGIIFQSGHWIINVLYDDRYTAAGPMLETLAIGIIIVPYLLTEQCLLSSGNTKAVFLSNTIRTVAIFSVTPITFLQFGLQGALWGIVLSSLIYVPISFYYLSRMHILQARRELVAIPLILSGHALGMLLNKALDAYHATFFT